MKSHDLYLSPSIPLARFREGDIIGFDNDNGQSNKIDNWWVAHSLAIVTAFKYQDFVEIWKLIESKISSLSIMTVRTWTMLK